jgi:hypothetical protein
VARIKLPELAGSWRQRAAGEAVLFEDKGFKVEIMDTGSVIKAIGNNEERKEITARRHKILTWKTLSNKER